MPTLDPKFKIGGTHAGSDAATRARAVYGEGFTDRAAHRLILSGDTPEQFAAALSEARDMRALVRLCAPQMEGLDNEAGINDAIARGIPLSTVRAEIADLLADIDMNTHTDSSHNPWRSKRADGQSSQTAGIYAQREAQIDALSGKNV